MPNVREDRRKLRIQGVARQIINNSKKGLDTSYNELITWAMLNFSVAKRTAREYVEAALYIKDFEKMGDVIFYKKKTDSSEEKIIEEADKILTENRNI